MRNSAKRNVGYLVERARHSIKERAFAETWIKWNTPDYTNIDLVQRLFMRKEEGKPPRLILSTRERFIIATVIQWLGTNHGFSFINRVLEFCGYEIIENRNNQKKYYDPFSESRDASVWYNLNNDIFLNSRPLKSKIVHRITKRKHLLRFIKNGFGSKVCIRCGARVLRHPPPTYPPKDINSKECYPPINKNFRVKKIKRLNN